MREFVVAGLLMSPFVKFALIAGLLYLPLRLILAHLQVYKLFWHPMLAEVSLYICLLAAVNLLL